MTGYKYIVQRALTSEFLDRDLVIKTDGPVWELSGPGSLTGTVSPDVGALRADDGGLLLEEWGSFIYAEADGLIRWGGILVSSEFDGDEWRIEAAGFTTYPHGIPFGGEFYRIGVDPLDAFREVWANLQSHPDGNLGVQVTGTPSTPVRLGTPAQPGWVEYKIDGEWLREGTFTTPVVPTVETEVMGRISDTSTHVAVTDVSGFYHLPLPFTVSIGAEKVLVTRLDSAVKAEDGTYVLDSFYGRATDLSRLNTLAGLTRGIEGTSATSHYEGTDVDFKGTERREVDGPESEPYTLFFWEAPDCGDELDTLAQTTPFDYVERHYWDGEDIRHEVEVGYPRLGRRRDDLAFVQGDNVTNVVTFKVEGDDLANEVLGLGSGEGRTTLIRVTAERDGRLRRPHVYSDKGVSDPARMDALIRDELARRRAALRIESIDVVDHANARIGSWNLGDDILVDAVVPWLGRVQVWCRITAYQLTGETTARLTLARSDSFRYGG